MPVNVFSPGLERGPSGQATGPAALVAVVAPGDARSAPASAGAVLRSGGNAPANSGAVNEICPIVVGIAGLPWPTQPSGDLVLIIRGNAPALLQTRAGQFIQAVAAQNATIRNVVADPHIRLMVLVDVVASDSSSSEEVDRDQNTRIAWVQPDSQITITMEIADDGTGLYDGLLHELILHVVPAALKHAAAVARQAAPVYPVTDAQIQAEEAQEHAAQAAWQTVADVAVALGIAGLLDAVVMDTCAHSKAIARAVVGALLQRRGIDQEAADELLAEINS